MTDTVEDLVALMDLERLELDLFRGTGSGGETSVRIFGGHVVAQALAAAYHTVETRLCHSLHALSVLVIRAFRWFIAWIALVMAAVLPPGG